MVIKPHIVIGGLFQRVLILLWLFLTLLIPGVGDLHGQRSPFDPALSAEAARIHEQVDCFTDRSLYITEELIRFRATLQGNGPTDRGPWSTVLYVEVVSPEGEQLARGKYLVRDGVSSGEISIPDHLLSGHYYLRCYTRWMRNRGPESFCYIPLRIVNPKRPELDGVISPEEAVTSLPVRMIKREILEFETHPASFGRGDSVTLDLLVSGGDLPDSIGGCLTVVPRSARPADQMWDARTSDRDSPDDFQLNFLPDKYGPSLSGSVKYPGMNAEELPAARIHFTLMGDVPGYFVCRSDAYGRFTVGLPARTGKLELFVQPESQGSGPVEVRIDQDFDSRQLRLPAPFFKLSEKEVQAATIMSRNVQLDRIYSKSKQTSESMADQGASGEAFPFYGSPTRSIDLDQYVLLPTLKEVFLNLVPGVTPITRRNRTSLQIYSENPALSLFDPLILVDQVPVLDMNQFMSISPAKIRRVDVIEDVYVKGNLRFGGIINLRSREKDMAGIDLPIHSFFIDYLAIHPPVPVLQDPISSDDRMPDIRNTLLWSPDLWVEKGTTTEIPFIAPAYPGEYVVLFRGQGAGGELIMAETTFKVLQ